MTDEALEPITCSPRLIIVRDAPSSFLVIGDAVIILTKGKCPIFYAPGLPPQNWDGVEPEPSQ